MEKEKLEKSNIVIEKDKNSLEISQESLELMKEGEKEFDKIADEEIKRSQEITERLIALGATTEEVENVKAEFEKADQEIEQLKETSMKKLFSTLGDFYVENIQNLDKSLLAEFTIRPIHRKYHSIEKKIEKQEQFKG